MGNARLLAQSRAQSIDIDQCKWNSWRESEKFTPSAEMKHGQHSLTDGTRGWQLGEGGDSPQGRLTCCLVALSQRRKSQGTLRGGYGSLGASARTV